MSVLQQICEQKRAHIASQKQNTTFEELKAMISDQAPPRGFIKNLQHVSQEGIALITEVKKASPSKGVICENFDPKHIAKAYENAGAACVSVLTDEPYFQGHDNHFREVRQTISLPMIRKDFMLEPYQIYESRAMGADCILLIMAALDDSQAQELHDLSRELDMDVLVEIHDEQELERTMAMNPAMIGVNNRNLKTLNVDIQTSFDFADKIPRNIVKIAESGLTDFQTVSKLKTVGYSGFLVGESLMRQPDIETAVYNLSGK